MSQLIRYLTSNKAGKEDKMRSMVNVLGLLLAVLVLGLPSMASALTASGTDISNTATVNYKVGGADQTLIESDPAGNTDPGVGQGVATTFKVDNKVIFTVVSDGGTSVAPGETDVALPFTLTNSGNTTQAFALAVSQTSKTITDALGTATIHCDGGDDGLYADDATDVPYVDATTCGNVTGDTGSGGGTLKLLIVVDSIPGTANSAENAVYRIVATAYDAGGAAQVTAVADAAAWVPGTVQAILADGSSGIGADAAKDGDYYAEGTITVAVADLTVTKTSAIISDGVNATNFKALPGAVIEYTITVANGAGAATATSVTITDTIDTDTTFKADGYEALKGISLNFNGGGAVNQTNADDSGTDDSKFVTDTVTVAAITLTAGQNAIIKFMVTID